MSSDPKSGSAERYFEAQHQERIAEADRILLALDAKRSASAQAGADQKTDEDRKKADRKERDLMKRNITELGRAANAQSAAIRSLQREVAGLRASISARQVGQHVAVRPESRRDGLDDELERALHNE